MNRCEICAQRCNLDDVLCEVCRGTITCLAEIRTQNQPSLRTGATFRETVAEQPAAGIAKNHHSPRLHAFLPAAIVETSKKLFSRLCHELFPGKTAEADKARRTAENRM